MWVKREPYLAVIAENARLAENVKSLQRVNEFYERELAYWRELADRERNRGDRAVDALADKAGVGPISDAGVEESGKTNSLRAEAAKKYGAAMREMFGESLGEEGEAGTSATEGEIPLTEELIGMLGQG